MKYNEHWQEAPSSFDSYISRHPVAYYRVTGIKFIFTMPQFSNSSNSYS